MNNFSKEQLMDVYRTMVLSRKLDEKMLIMLKQGKSYFHIGCSGHEAAQIAAGLSMNKGKDWMYGYYRSQSICLTLGLTPKEVFLHFLGKKDDPCSGGRQMPQHYGRKDSRIVSQGSSTGTQYLQGVGTAMATVRSKTNEVVYVSSGEGATSEGDFHEAINWAAREKLPVVFHIEDNGYAISVPKSEQTAGGSVYKIVAGYENLTRFEIDGTDFFESYATFKKATDHARSGKGPVLILGNVIRLLSHSSSDDHMKYRTKDALDTDKSRDPIVKFTKACLDAKLLTSADFEKIDVEVKKEVDDSAEWALTQPDPLPETAAQYNYATTESVKSEPKPKSTGEKTVLVDAINHALHEEMERNPKMLIYGEDVADGKGGVFTATKGLSTKFGKTRVFNSPLAESSIVGTAVGLAVAGYKPVVEIQFADYIWTAMMQIRNELAAMFYRSNGSFSCPAVIRVPTGGYIHGGLCHSQNIEAYFAHIPGLRVVYPSNAADAKGLLKAAIRGNDPVLFLEHKGLYRQGFAARPEPDADYILPLGIANVIQTGTALTIVTWGMMVQRAIESVRSLGIPDGQVEIIDIRTMNPLDMDTILTSVKKTGKVLILHEENITGGFGAEIAAQIATQAFEYLDGPVQRIGAKDSHIPYHPNLEDFILPQTAEISETIQRLLKY